VGDSGSVTSATNGVLPPEGDAEIEGVWLPAGRLIRPGPPRGIARIGRAPEPALWLSAEFDDAPAAWLDLKDRLDGSGLVPLLLSTLEGQPDRPWAAGELSPEDTEVVDGLDLDEVIAELWAGGVPDPDEDPDETAELLAPFGRPFPGLAPATSRLAAPADLAAATASVDLPAGIGLVRAGRPADALVAAGWQGAANMLDSPAPLALVLRSWEDRFGARLMHLGFDTMALLVERPVPDGDEAFGVAAEHFAFCTDNITQGQGSISDYAEELPGATSWWFWWD
jgi:hypothetical protein